MKFNNNLGYNEGDIIKRVDWNWDALWMMIITIILFPLWIRQVRYMKVIDMSKEKRKKRKTYKSGLESKEKKK